MVNLNNLIANMYYFTCEGCPDNCKECEIGETLSKSKEELNSLLLLIIRLKQEIYELKANKDIDNQDSIYDISKRLILESAIESHRYYKGFAVDKVDRKLYAVLKEVIQGVPKD